MSIQVKNFTKTYGKQKAVDNISFQLNKGELVGFIGPNGSGKSTTMKTICGLITPDSGEILVNNKNITESALEIKNIIGYLPENNPLYYDMYVSEYLNFVGGMYKIKGLKKRVDEVIELTGLKPEKHKRVGELSKGFKQRVGIAQALIHDPEILILDEPTTGLDPNQLVEIRKMISNLAVNKTVLLSTHILQEVEAICTRVIMINNGQIAADEATNLVGQNKNSVQTVLVEFKENIEQQDLFAIPGVSNFKLLKDKTWLFESSEKEDIRENIFSFAKENNISILELQTKKHTLEDTFRELTK